MKRDQFRIFGSSVQPVNTDDFTAKGIIVFSPSAHWARLMSRIFLPASLLLAVTLMPQPAAKVVAGPALTQLAIQKASQETTKPRQWESIQWHTVDENAVNWNTVNRNAVNWNVIDRAKVGGQLGLVG